jgi:hypothetical protein
VGGLAFHDPNDARGDRALNALNAGQPLGQEFVHVFVGAEDTRRDDVVAPRTDAEEKNLGKLGETPGGSIHLGEARLDLDHGVMLVADLERVGPRAELDDLAPDQLLDAVPDGGLRHLKAAGQVGVGKTTVGLQLTDQLRIQIVEVSGPGIPVAARDTLHEGNSLLADEHLDAFLRLLAAVRTGDAGATQTALRDLKDWVTDRIAPRDDEDSE